MSSPVKEITQEVVDNLNKTIVVLDTETTGFSKYYDRVIEFGAIKLTGGKVVDTFTSLINPEIPIPYKSTQVHGITDSMVENAPTEKEISSQIVDFLSGSCYIVGHNVNFDIGFLEEMFKRNGYYLNCMYIDTLKFARQYFKNVHSHKLVDLAEYLNIEVVTAHRALADVETTIMLLRHIAYQAVKNKQDY